jgi:hypothetical protein
MSREPLEEYKYKEKLSLTNLNQNKEVLQKVSCPTCLSTVSADNINIQTNLAKCVSCDGIFSFHNQAGQLSNRDTIIQEILQPEGVALSHFLDELDISVQQPWGLMETILMSVVPFGILLIPAIASKTLPSNPVAGLAVLGFVLLSFMCYIAYFFMRKRHKVHVHIDDQYLYIEHRPRKMISDKQYAVQNIDQVYTKKTSSSMTGEKGFGIFMIYNGDEGQKHIELINMVSNRSKAKYMEQEIERQLGIADRKVPDED